MRKMTTLKRNAALFAMLVSLGAALSACAASPTAGSLADARKTFKTTISFSLPPESAPIPPSSIFRMVTYPSEVGPLSAYLTPDPSDGRRHPAIIWITGGDCNSIGDVWSPSPPDNDQTAQAYREAGIVMMFPSLRGGNDNPGKHEAFYGEVDDVLTAFDYLARQPYVMPDRIYLGGHSTGGTLVLLTAEVRNPFRAVFAFGPVGVISSYGYSSDFLPVDFSQYDEQEVQLRSPAYWLQSAQGVVYIIEGTSSPSNIKSLNMMQRLSTNSALHFIAVPNANHFSVLAPSNAVIAGEILKDTSSQQDFELPESEIQNPGG